jgi:hypothetical protein
MPLFFSWGFWLPHVFDLTVKKSALHYHEPIAIAWMKVELDLILEHPEVPIGLMIMSLVS